MIISEEYERLMFYNELPERFRAGDFGLLEDEIATLRGFVDSFYASVVVQNIIAEVFMKSAEIRNRLS